MDRISKLPSGIIETILCLLPIQEAARTSILSREWRYHWIKIPKLVFDEDTFQISADGDELSVLEQTFNKPGNRKVMTKRCKLFYAIYQVLLMHEGPIHEFALSMEVDESCVEIDHIILHLSKKNTIKMLKLDFKGDYKLPLSFFSLHQLTDLYLKGCALELQPSFNGFGSLTTLYVHFLSASEKTLLHLLSSCPLLKRLTLNSDGFTTAIPDEDFSIVNLFECLPIVEYLSVWVYIVLLFDLYRLPKELPTTLVHLKYLCIEYICFCCEYGLPFLFLLIRSSPNLKKLKLEMTDDAWLHEHEMGSVSLKEYSDILLEHLNELEIINFTNTENELDFVKLMLAKSPVIKEVRVFLSNQFAKDEELQISEILLHLPCASPVVKVTVRSWRSN